MKAGHLTQAQADQILSRAKARTTGDGPGSAWASGSDRADRVDRTARAVAVRGADPARPARHPSSSGSGTSTSTTTTAA